MERLERHKCCQVLKGEVNKVINCLNTVQVYGSNSIMKCLEITKGPIRSCTSKKDREPKCLIPSPKKAIDNNPQTLHSKLKIEEHELQKIPEVNYDAPDGLEVNFPLTFCIFDT